ncbi:DUF4249 domain-containing protein [bacterium]|nr:DUF4249 domain-containing protein [bacterium]
MKNRTIIPMCMTGLPKGIMIVPVLFLVLFACSCSEDVIKVKLKNTKPRIVIEGTVTDRDPAMVRISKTVDFFKPTTLPAVSGALVTISDSESNVYTLKEIVSGIYIAEKLRGIEGQTYTMNVFAEGVEYTAVSTMQHAVVIDSLSQDYDEEDELEIHCYLTDPEGIDNFYRIRLFRNGTAPGGITPDSNYWFSDKVTDGKKIDYYFFDTEDFEIDDVITVELLTIDEGIYDFFMTLDSALGDNSSFGTLPGNPISNISNGALGYFGAFTIRSAELTVK